MEIVNVNSDNYDTCLNFLNKVKSLENIDMEILKNASVIISDNNEIEGILSYEKFASYGLIRYFVYKKSLDEENLIELFNHLKEKIKKDNIRTIISLILREDVIDIFKKFGFLEIDAKLFFIEETNILKTNFHDAFVLKFEIP